MPANEPYLTGTGQRRCVGTNRSGRPCEGFALRDEDRCWVHSERRQVEVRAAQSVGGTRSRGGKLKARLEEIIQRLYGTRPDRSFRLRDDIDDPQGVVNTVVIDGTKMIGYGCGNPFECAWPFGRRSEAWKSHKMSSHTRRGQALWLVAIEGGPGNYTYRGHGVSDDDVKRYLTAVGIKRS